MLLVTSLLACSFDEHELVLWVSGSARSKRVVLSVVLGRLSCHFSSREVSSILLSAPLLSSPVLVVVWVSTLVSVRVLVSASVSLV